MNNSELYMYNKGETFKLGDIRKFLFLETSVIILRSGFANFSTIIKYIIDLIRFKTTVD